MKWKTTLALLITTVSLGAYVSLYEIKRPSPERREQLARRLLNIDFDDVTMIVIEREHDTVSVKRDGTNWRLDPSQLRAHDELFDQIIMQSEILESQRILSGTNDDPLDIAAFGLKPPAVKITISSGDQSTNIRLGETTAIGAGRYVQVDDRPEIFIVVSAIFATATLPLDTFRDPVLIRFDAWLVDKISATWPEGGFTLVRQDTQWHLTNPVNDLTDRYEITNLIGKISNLRIERFVDDEPSEETLLKSGIQTAHTQLVISEEGRTTTLKFGAILPDEPSLIYANRSDEAALYTVSLAAVEELRPDPHTLRSKSCFDFFTSKVERVKLQHGELSWIIEQKNGTWRETSSSELLNTDLVENFLKKLSDLRFGGFVEDNPADLAKYGLDPSVGVITVWIIDDDTPQRLFVGDQMEDSANQYARIEGRDVVVRVPESILKILDTAPLSFRPAPDPV